MVNKGCLLLFLIFYSCCDYTSTSYGGLRSKEKYKSKLKKRVIPSLVKIKTDVVYKSINLFYEEENRKLKREIDSLYLTRDDYYKFYSNGTYYNFIKGINEKLDSDSFNPLKGNLGFVVKENKKILLSNYSTLNCGIFIRREFEVRGDTLIVKHGSNKGYRIWYYYVKRNMPKEWLAWKPYL